MAKKRRWLLIAAAAWDTGWKFAALWKAVGRQDWKWIPPLITVNSLGLLPMAYIYFIAKDDDEA